MHEGDIYWLFSAQTQQRDRWLVQTRNATETTYVAESECLVAVFTVSCCCVRATVYLRYTRSVVLAQGIRSAAALSQG